MKTSEIMSAMIFGDGGASKVEELSTDGGSTDAGKVLVVGDNGKIAASDLTVGEGEIALDKTLSVNGAAADAKKTGDAISALNGSLKAINDLGTIDLINGYHIDTNKNVGAIVDLTPIANQTQNDGGYAIIDCAPGDQFVVSCSNNAPQRSWLFIDKDDKVITRASAFETYYFSVISAPTLATKLVISSVTGGISIKGLTAAQKAKIFSEELIYALNATPATRIGYDSIIKWYSSNPAFKSFFLPITVKKKILLMRLRFATTFSSACNLYILVTSTDGTTQYASASYIIAESGEHEISIPIPAVLEPNEYRLVFSVSEGTLNWPNKSGMVNISDDCIENTGTAYQSDNSNIVYIGDILYSDGSKTLEDADKDIDRIVFKDPDVSSHVFVSQNAAVTISNDVITFDYAQSSGLTSWLGFKYGVSKDVLINGLVEISGTATLVDSSKLIVYIYGTKTNNNIFLKSLGLIESSGDFDFVADVNSFAMYDDLDLTKDIGVQVGMRTQPCYATVEGFQISTPKYYLDGDKLFYENVNEMAERIESNTNNIAVLSQDKYLVSPDGSKFLLSVSNSGVLSAIPVIPNKVLFIGNSFLLGQEDHFGMAASDADHDYYHYVTQAILAKKPTATFTKLRGVSFEQATSVANAESWMQSTLLPELNSDLNLVLVQLAENVATTEMKNVFAVTCAEMIQYIKEYAPNARVAWAGSYYSSGSNNIVVQTIAEACASKGATFIDTSALPKYMSYVGAVINYGAVQTRTYSMDSYVDDSTNHTLTITFTVGDNQYTANSVPYNSYTIDTGTISITGEYGFLNTSAKANHPSDAGMLEIANKMITVLGFN